MKKETKVTQDNKQTRSTIPQKFVDEFKVTNKDKVQWEDTRGMLRGRLIQEVNKKRNTQGERSHEVVSPIHANKKRTEVKK